MSALLTPKQAAALFPGRDPGKPLTKETVVNWSRLGILNRDTGERVHLAVSRIGGRLYLTKENLDAFLAALSPEPPTETPARKTTKKKAHA